MDTFLVVVDLLDDGSETGGGYDKYVVRATTINDALTLIAPHINIADTLKVSVELTSEITSSVHQLAT